MSEHLKGEIQGWYLIIALVCFVCIAVNIITPIAHFDWFFAARIWLLGTIGGIFLMRGLI